MELGTLEKKLSKINATMTRVRFSRGMWRVTVQYGIPYVSDTLFSIGSGVTLEDAFQACFAKIPEVSTD